MQTLSNPTELKINKMKQHKKCGYCKAFNRNYSCELGYKIKAIFFDRQIAINAIPLEPCEKPTSTKKLVELLMLNTKNKQNANNKQSN